jgi:hypothetical protein
MNNMIRWNIAVSANTDQSLRSFLSKQGAGKKEDLSRFIEEAVRAHILELTAEQAKSTNASVVEADLMHDAINNILGRRDEAHVLPASAFRNARECGRP